MPGRTLIIGDVHGCFDEMQDLLRLARYGPGDALVFVGDLVAKGPRSLDVLRFVRNEPGARAVRGNHDDVLLDVLDGRVHGRPQHEAIAAEMDADDVAWLRATPLWLDLPEHGVRVVHAGQQAGVPIEQQDPALLMTMRALDDHGLPTARAAAGAPWACSWEGPPFVVFGHHASAGLQQHPAALGLDTGCVYGRHLSAYVLPARRIISVRARQTYADPGGPGRTYAGPVASLQRDPRAVPLGPDEHGRPREALVLKDAEGVARAFLNRCEHIPVPLDAGSRRFLSADRSHLLCGTHGAKYRLDDGYCIAGPCSGSSLQAVPLAIERDLVWLLDT